MFLLDTNILVSEIITAYERDERTQQYREFVKHIPLPKRVISDFILSEFETLMVQVIPSRYKVVMNAVERKELKAITSANINRIIAEYTLVSPSALTIKNAYGFYKRFENSHYISFTDSLLLATAQTHGYTIISKDERLIEQAKGLRISFYGPKVDTNY